MKNKLRRQLQLKILDRIQSDLVNDYGLTPIEQAYLFTPGGTAEQKLTEILQCRINFYQLIKYGKQQ